MLVYLQDICKCEVEMMSVTRTGSGNLVLGLGTASGQVFVVSIREAGELVWCALDSGTSTRNRVKRLDECVDEHIIQCVLCTHMYLHTCSHICISESIL